MPIDPNIIAGLKPVQIQTPDPLEQYGKTLTLRNLMQQGDLGTLQYEHAQRAGESEKRLNALFANNANPTPEEVTAADPNFGIKYRRAALDAQKTQSEIAKNQQEVEVKALASHRDELANVKTPEDAAAWVMSGFKDPILGPLAQRSGKTPDQVLATIPKDPQELQTWIQRNALGATKYIEANKPKVTSQNLGGTEQLVSTPGLGGAPSVLSSTPRTMAPGEGQRLAIERARLGVTAATADPFGTLGIRDIAAKAGAPVAGGQGGAGVPPVSAAAQAPQVTGPDYLATLPKSMADQVKALAEGRMQFPAGFALKSPYWQQMIQSVSQYDPSFDAVNYNARASVRKDFTSGTSAKSLNALNTVMGHLDDFEKAATALNNTGMPLVNAVANTVGSAVSPDLKGRLNRFNLTKQAVVSEMERAYRGTGGSQADIESWKKTLNDADSPEAIRASISQGVKLLGSKIEALGNQYSQGMGTTKSGLELLNPKARATFTRLIGEGGSEAQTATGSITPATTFTREQIDAELKRRGVTKP